MHSHTSIKRPKHRFAQLSRRLKRSLMLWISRPAAMLARLARLLLFFLKEEETVILKPEEEEEEVSERQNAES